MKKRILVLGGAHLDRRGRIAADTVAGASNPGTWREDVGGGAFNVARNLARLGHAVELIAPRGGDAAGQRVAEEASLAGIDDRPFVFLDRATPSYTAILEQDGNLVIALADMELYRLFTPRRLRARSVREAMARADLIVCDANLPAETLSALGAEASARGIALAGIAISPAKVIRFRKVLPDIAWLFMNSAEAAALAGAAASPDQWADLLRPLGLSGGVVTNRGEDVAAFDSQTTLMIKPPPASQIVDVTGAGDALAAGVLDALLAGESLPRALVRGIAASQIALASPYAAPPELDRNLLERKAAEIAASTAYS
ncbi:Carbohydrate kinase protein [Pseudorhizobium banfieldiae]|uniref:Carbohydrate kinase protein n=1 Tax=Pseudorhizobium banfieldiae TaxID=1125847 RepID=L0NFG1_9HYPH|nr:carbohydrate kinase family protein [Pseudorhizobium banfieldiae]CAD6610039.1 carbohydrate kinase [arsenite-oxidising bacterium NT-25]CCF19619.1 Carbohydrate kinase protein [Pseudorhizobium banfieldiae]